MNFEEEGSFRLPNFNLSIFSQGIISCFHEEKCEIIQVNYVSKKTFLHILIMKERHFESLFFMELKISEKKV